MIFYVGRSITCKSGVQFVLNSFVEQVMLYLFCNEVILEASYAHMAKFLDPDEASTGKEERLFPLTSFMASIATWEMYKKHRKMQDRKYIAPVVPDGVVDNTQRFDDDSYSPPTRSDFGSEEIHRKKSSKRR